MICGSYTVTPERAGKTVGESSRVVLLNISHASAQCGQRMPALGAPLTAGEIDLIRRWIEGLP